MKKFIVPFVALFALSVAIISWKSSAKAVDGAIHIDGFTCGFPDGDGNFALLGDGQAVITPSGNGMWKCQGGGVPNSTGKAVKYNYANTGGLCFTPQGGTDDWQVTISASGQTTFMCHNK